MDKTLIYKASIALGAIGLLASVWVFFIVNGAIDGIGASAHAALVSVNGTVSSAGSLVDASEGFVNTTDATITGLIRSVAPLSGGIRAAGEAFGSVSSFISQIPGGSSASIGLSSAAGALQASASSMNQTEGSLSNQSTALSSLRGSIGGLRAQVDGARRSVDDAQKELDESLGSLRLVSLLFLLMNLALFSMQILNAYAGMQG